MHKMNGGERQMRLQGDPEPAGWPIAGEDTKYSIFRQRATRGSDRLLILIIRILSTLHHFFINIPKNKNKDHQSPGQINRPFRPEETGADPRRSDKVL